MMFRHLTLSDILTHLTVSSTIYATNFSPRIVFKGAFSFVVAILGHKYTPHFVVLQKTSPNPNKNPHPNVHKQGLNSSLAAVCYCGLYSAVAPSFCPPSKFNLPIAQNCPSSKSSCPYENGHDNY